MQARIRKYLITLLLISLVYAWYFAFKTVRPPSYINVLGASENITLFTQPETGNKVIIDAINGAKKEILVEVYLLSDKNIITALEDAKVRGVDVRVMLEQHPFGGGGLNEKTKVELESRNISFEWANSSFALTHEKSVVIDGKTAFILNQNLTTASFTSNREYDVIDANPSDVLQIRNIFIADWQRQEYSLQKSNLIVSPENSRPILLNLINSAKHNIYVEMEVIGDDEMITLLSQKAKNTTIKILAPPISKVSSNKIAFKKLTSSGVQIKTLQSPYIHAKMIMIDNNTVYIGSINLTTQSLDKNRELGIILTQKEVIDLISDVFSQDFEKGTDYNK